MVNEHASFTTSLGTGKSVGVNCKRGKTQSDNENTVKKIM